MFLQYGGIASTAMHLNLLRPKMDITSSASEAAIYTIVFVVKIEASI